MTKTKKLPTHPTAPLYFAYGSNLNLEQFRRRCPLATPVSRCTLDGYKLVFKGVADIVPSKKGRVYGAIYRITNHCEAALDRYEGFPHLYVKEYLPVEVTTHNGDKVVEDMMFYVMVHDRIAEPSSWYFNTILRGFNDWKLNKRSLHDALAAAKAVKRKPYQGDSDYQWINP